MGSHSRNAAMISAKGATLLASIRVDTKSPNRLSFSLTRCHPGMLGYSIVGAVIGAHVEGHTTLPRDGGNGEQSR
jgi:hypothetical protein